MSTPNMSGRTDAPPTTDDHHDPTDLLGEDGTVDVSKVKQIANAADPQRLTVSREECATIRERLARENLTAEAVGREVGYGGTAVRNHATGACCHVHDTPPVAYDPGAGWQVDE